MPKIKILSGPSLDKYQAIGQVGTCPTGYVKDPSGKCVPNNATGVPTLLDPNSANQPNNFSGYNNPQDWTRSLYNPSAPSATVANTTPTVLPPYSPSYTGPLDPNAVAAFDPNAQPPVTPKKPGFGQRVLTGAGNFLKGVDNFQKNPWTQLGAAALKYGITASENKQRQKDFNRSFRESLFPKAIGVANRGNYTMDGIYKPDEMTPPNEGMFGNQFYSQQNNIAAEGGEQLNNNSMSKIRIRILETPNMKYGGQSDHGLDIGQRKLFVNQPMVKTENVSDTLQPVPREYANIEAEKGETVYGDFDGDGSLEHFKIGGKRHSEGGTPLNVKEGSFIFSDTKKMTIRDKDILAYFGLSPRKGGYTPAEIAKRYDVNKYKAIIEDPDKDGLMKDTAQLMMKNYEQKLARLAMIQEGMKGFPQGIPEIARKVMFENKEGAPQQSPEEESMETDEQQSSEDESMEQQPQMAYGGSLERFAGGGGTGDPWRDKIEKIKALNKKVAWSGRFQAGDVNIPSVQYPQTSGDLTGVYGDITKDDINDFKARHKWFFDANPGWDPKNQADVLRFQNAYNARAIAKGANFDFFDSNSTKMDKLDGKMGEYTYNAPDLSDEQQPQPTPGKKYKCENGQAVESTDGTGYDDPTEALKNCPQKTDEIPPKQELKYKCVNGIVIESPDGTTFEEAAKNCIPAKQQQQKSAGFMTPDVINMGAAAAVPPKKYLPWFASTRFEPGQLSLEDWRAQAATAFGTQYAAPMATLSQYSGRQGVGAMASKFAGDAAENITGRIIPGVVSRNVDRVNQFGLQEQARKDQANLLESERANKLYLGNVVANQQMDNSMRQYVNDLAKTYGTAWKNRMYLDMLNKSNPYFNVDNRSGLSSFVKGYNNGMLGRNTSGSTAINWGDINTGYMNAKRSLPDLTLDKYLEYTRKSGAGSSSDASGMVPYYMNAFPG